MQREIIEGDGFFISYAVAGSGPTGDETALVKKESFEDNEYYILNGDWLERYRPLVAQGFESCKHGTLLTEIDPVDLLAN